MRLHDWARRGYPAATVLHYETSNDPALAEIPETIEHRRENGRSRFEIAIRTR
jgi:hypothetical protein